MIPTRIFGSTGLEVSVLGLGGFHQVEIGQGLVTRLVDLYMDAGGNYVETARSYGGGVSEVKLGHALQGRRDSVILVSKTGQRTAEGAWRELNESIEALQTDRLDVLLYHGISDLGTLNAIAGPGGAAEAFERAREQGLVRFVGASSHWPTVLIPAVEQLKLDAIMCWINYLVTCNYPEIYDSVLPAVRQRSCAVIGMKPLGDGYLYRSVPSAFSYALAQDADVLACGFNSVEMLKADIEAVTSWSRPSQAELDKVLRDAPELGTYVCRQCGQCKTRGVDLPRVFELEGKFDRQMFDGQPTDAPDYALRQRLMNWFDNRDRARDLYRPLCASVSELLASGDDLPECSYGIDLARKLAMAHAKLSGSGSFPSREYDF